MNSQDPNENMDLLNEPRDDGSPGAEGAMALPLARAQCVELKFKWWFYVHVITQHKIYLYSKF